MATLRMWAPRCSSSHLLVSSPNCPLSARRVPPIRRTYSHCAAQAPIAAVDSRLRSLLSDYPDHPVLLQLAAIAARCLDLPATAPLKTALTGLELLLARAQVCGWGWGWGWGWGALYQNLIRVLRSTAAFFCALPVSYRVMGLCFCGRVEEQPGIIMALGPFPVA